MRTRQVSCSVHDDRGGVAVDQAVKSARVSPSKPARAVKLAANGAVAPSSNPPTAPQAAMRSVAAPILPSERENALDHIVHTNIARLTGGLSPMALALATLDWGMHLAVSPGRQGDLAPSALAQAGGSLAQGAVFRGRERRRWGRQAGGEIRGFAPRNEVIGRFRSMSMLSLLRNTGGTKPPPRSTARRATTSTWSNSSGAKLSTRSRPPILLRPIPSH